MAYFPPERPMCAVCLARVEKFRQRINDPTGEIEYIAECHGAVQIVRVDPRDLRDMVRGYHGQVEFGLAFEGCNRNLAVGKSAKAPAVATVQLEHESRHNPGALDDS